MMMRRVEKVKEVLSRLLDLEDSQMVTTLLCSCLTLPRMAFSLWTCPLTILGEARCLLMRSCRKSWLIGVSWQPSFWLGLWLIKASLPSSWGGLNIRKVSLDAPAAYFGSLEQSSTLVTRILRRVLETPLTLLVRLSFRNCSKEGQKWCSEIWREGKAPLCALAHGKLA